jgi:hypothetical protein
VLREVVGIVYGDCAMVCIIDQLGIAGKEWKGDDERNLLPCAFRVEHDRPSESSANQTSSIFTAVFSAVKEVFLNHCRIDVFWVSV